jgi:hypothetical protein
MLGGDPMQARNEKLEAIAQLAEDIAARARAIPMDSEEQHKLTVLDFVLIDLQVALQELETLTEDDYRD